ncbi:MAG: hypothetical protein Q9209_006178 [Squamulea sp. 1 TL-2023]
MQFSTTCLALALALASGALSRPQQYEQPTISGQDGYIALSTSARGFGSNLTTVPEACMMFMPYVPPVFLGEVCSLHLTPLAPGSMRTLPTSCFSSVVGIPTIRRQDPFTLEEPTTTQRDGGYEQPTSSQRGGGNEQPTTASEPTIAEDIYGGLPTMTAVTDEDWD